MVFRNLYWTFLNLVSWFLNLFSFPTSNLVLLTFFSLFSIFYILISLLRTSLSLPFSPCPKGRTMIYLSISKKNDYFPIYPKTRKRSLFLDSILFPSSVFGLRTSVFRLLLPTFFVSFLYSKFFFLYFVLLYHFRFPPALKGEQWFTSRFQKKMTIFLFIPKHGNARYFETLFSFHLPSSVFRLLLPTFLSLFYILLSTLPTSNLVLPTFLSLFYFLYSHFSTSYFSITSVFPRP